MADLQRQSLWEQFSRGFEAAVTDIREKAVEEPWFGRVVTERNPTAPHWPQAREEQSQPEPDKDIDRDIDR
jgi:hypothetical protein